MVYKASALRGLALTHMALGCLMVVFGVASNIAVDYWTSLAGFGIWIGVWVIISGILGCGGAKNDSMPNKCLIGCFMGFSIIACVLAGIMIMSYCVALSAFAEDLEFRCKTRYDYRGSYNECGYKSESKRERAKTGVGIGSCLLIVAVVEFFVALASSIYCCKAVCSSSTGLTQTQTQQVIFVPAQQMYQGGQAAMVVNQPSGQVTTMPTNYPAHGQQVMYVSQQQPNKNVEMPPPYSTGNVSMAPVASAPPEAHVIFRDV